MKLTKSVAEAARYQGKQSTGKDGKTKWSRFILWDDELVGFGLRITPQGRKSFVLLYRPEGSGRQRLMTLGAYGALTVDQARKKAIRERAKAIEGRDPLAERQAKRAVEMALHSSLATVSQLTERYLDYSEDRKKESSLRNDRQMIRDYVIPAFGKLAIQDVRSSHISELHLSLRGRPYAANRLLALLRRMFNLAQVWDQRPKGAEPLVNPCHGVEPFAEVARERYLTPEELGRLGEVLEFMEKRGRIPACAANENKTFSVIPSAVTALRLILFTGCRREEIMTLKWEHVDLKNSRITLEDSKTGPRLFPIGEAAVQVLRMAPRKDGNPYVCWGRKTGGYLVGLPKIWRYVRNVADIADVRIHDLRHTFGSVGVGAAGLNLPVVGKLLGHTQAATTQRYAHVADDPAKVAADRISERIAAGLAGAPSTAPKSEADELAMLNDLMSRIGSLSADGRKALSMALAASD